MTFSLYAHAWQAILMFLAGVVCIGSSLVGYLRAGGGEELLQQALLTMPTHGKATFGQLDLDLAASTLTVRGIRHSPIEEPGAKIDGITADACVIHLDLWPHLGIESVSINGVPNLEFVLQGGFLQRGGGSYPKGPPFPVYFENVHVGATIGDVPRMDLDDCSGKFEAGPNGELVGEFVLGKLNGKPFNFSLASRAGGRWEFVGKGTQIDTQPLRNATAGGHDDVVDPLQLLVRALLAGEFGAKGYLPSLRVWVQPAADGRPFMSEGQVQYQNLDLALPPRQSTATPAAPNFMDWMMGERKRLWPQWLVPERIETGPDGRISFRMEGNCLDFNCDEGPGSAFIVHAAGQSQPFAPLESFKGRIVTDDHQHPLQVILRGFLGDALSAEMRMRRGPKDERIYDLMLEPRAIGDAQVGFYQPLWRFRGRVEDLTDAPDARTDGTLVRFNIEVASKNLPQAFLLPPGVRDISGRVRIEGRYTDRRVLYLDKIRWEDGGLVFGGKADQVAPPLTAKAYGQLVGSLETFWGGADEPWELDGVTLMGQAEVYFDEDLRWLSTQLKGWKLESGRVIYKGQTTPIGESGLRIQGRYYREPGKEDRMADFVAGSRTEGAQAFDWSFALQGTLQPGQGGSLVFSENNVPRKYHPDYDRIPKEYTHGIFSKAVKRKTTLSLKDGNVTHAVE